MAMARVLTIMSLALVMSCATSHGSLTESESTVMNKFHDWIESHPVRIDPLSSETTIPHLTPGTLEAGVFYAKERQRIMSRLMERDAEAALNLALSEEERSSIHPSLADHVEFHINTVVDEFNVFASSSFDNPSRKTLPIERTIRIGDKVYRTSVSGDLKHVQTCENIPVNGIVLGDKASLHGTPVKIISHHEDNTVRALVGGSERVFESEERAMEEKFVPLGQPIDDYDPLNGEGHRYNVLIRVDFPDDTASRDLQDLDRLEQEFNGYMRQFIVHSSYGRADIETYICPTVFRLDHARVHYNPTSLRRAAWAKAAEVNDCNPSHFDYDMIMFDTNDNFDFGAYGYVGTRGVWLNGAAHGATTFIRQYGHNLGLWQSNFWQADTGHAVYSSTGTVMLEGNFLDIMGYPAVPDGKFGSPSSRVPSAEEVMQFHFSVYHKALLGWIKEEEIQRVSTSGVYRVYALDGGSHTTGVTNIVRALRIVKNADQDYFVEFRAQQTCVQDLDQSVVLSVGRRDGQGRVANTEDGTLVLDMSPTSRHYQQWGSQDKENLPRGETFVDELMGLMVSPVRFGTNVVQDGHEMEYTEIQVSFDRAKGLDAPREYCQRHAVASQTEGYIINSPFSHGERCEWLITPHDMQLGLTGEYFNFHDTDFLAALPDFSHRIPTIVDVEPQIMFHDNDETWWSDLHLGDLFAARYSGYLKVETAGAYRFYLESSDGSKVIINGVTVINNDGTHSMLEKSSKTISLDKGMQRIEIHYFRNGGTAGLIFRWEGPGFDKQVVPKTQLYHHAGVRSGAKIQRMTIDGEFCHLPFVYKGVTYNDCTGNDNRGGGDWCSLDAEYQGNWGRCAPGFMDGRINHIALTFEQFDIESEVDWVRIYDGPTNEAPLLGEFTGGNAPSMVYSSSTTMLVSFHSQNEQRNLNEFAGFVAYYQGLPVDDGPCSGVVNFKSRTGTIEENRYRNNADCTWVIEPENGEDYVVDYIELTFERFDLEPSHDFLYILDVDGFEIAAYTGNEIPNVLRTDTLQRKVIVRFVSDEAVTGAGFTLHFKAERRKAWCRDLLELTDDSNIFTDGSPLGTDYLPNSRCQWLISPRNLQAGHIEFRVSTSLADHNDTLTVYNGGSVKSDVLHVFSGRTGLEGRNTVIRSSSPFALVVFESDGEKQGSGFSVTYNVVEKESEFCGAEKYLRDHSGFIRSSGASPMQYVSHARCEWHIAPPIDETEYVVLRFLEKDLAPRLTVTVYDGDLEGYDPNIRLPGLMAEYYTFDSSLTEIPDLDGVKAGHVRVDKEVNFVHKLHSANDWKLPKHYNEFALRLTGFLKVDTAGLHKFYLSSDDGSRMFIDGDLIIDNDGVHGMSEMESGEIDLTEGYHEIVVEYFTQGTHSGLILQWRPPLTGKAVIPGETLFHTQVARRLMSKLTHESSNEVIVRSTGPHMLVVFENIHHGSGTGGFLATYSTVPREIQCHDYPQHGPIVFGGNFGSISESPSESLYESNKWCRWHIMPTEPAAHIQLVFDDMDLEDGYDWIRVYDGIEEGARVIGHFTGSLVPHSLRSTGREMRLEFTSDATVNKGGFKAHYVLIPPESFDGVDIRDNVALGKPCTQSSTLNAGAASRAVDGNTDGQFDGGSVTHTEAQENPFWQVDLLLPTEVHKINIYSRTDCCGDELVPFKLELLDWERKEVASKTWTKEHTYYHWKVKEEVEAKNVYYAKISSEGTDRIISLAEFEVIGRQGHLTENGCRCKSTWEWEGQTYHGCSKAASRDRKEWCYTLGEACGSEPTEEHVDYYWDVCQREQLPSCGDGHLDGGELCDDGNNSNFDGCDAYCEIEYGYICTGHPSLCSEISEHEAEEERTDPYCRCRRPGEGEPWEHCLDAKHCGFTDKADCDESESWYCIWIENPRGSFRMMDSDKEHYRPLTDLPAVSAMEEVHAYSTPGAAGAQPSHNGVEWTPYVGGFVAVACVAAAAMLYVLVRRRSASSTATSIRL